MAIGCDTATLVTSARLNSILAKNYTFIGRYIEQVESVHNGLTATEAERISNAGLDIVSLYEPKGMDGANHYTSAQALKDVVEALKLARDLNQPGGSVIYFCVDFDATESDVQNNIIPYFNTIYNAFVDREGNPEEYKLGIYGSGYVCSTVSQNRPTVYTMLAAATAWKGSSSYTAWNIKQSVQIGIGTGNGYINVCPCESSSRGTGGWRL